MKIEEKPGVQDLTPRADPSKYRTVTLRPFYCISDEARRQLQIIERAEAMVIETAYRHWFR